WELFFIHKLRKNTKFFRLSLFNRYINCFGLNISRETFRYIFMLNFYRMFTLTYALKVYKNIKVSLPDSWCQYTVYPFQRNGYMFRNSTYNIAFIVDTYIYWNIFYGFRFVI